MSSTGADEAFWYGSSKMNASVFVSTQRRPGRGEPARLRTSAEVAARRRARRAVALVVAVGLAVAAGVLTDRWSTPTHAEVMARKLVDAAVLPPGSVLLSRPPAGLAVAPTGYGCAPYADAVRYWVVPGSVASVASFLESHPAAGTRYSGSGGVTNGPLEFLSFAPGSQSGPRGEEVTFSFAAVGADSTGLRADAVVIPSSSACVTH